MVAAEPKPLVDQAREPSAKLGLGLGLGLRNVHFDHILTHWPAVDWFEAISENFMDSGGRPRDVIRRVADRYPIVLHGVSLSIGGTDPLNLDYLARLKALAAEIQPAWVSDHLCWTGFLGRNSHDLLPLPLTEEVLDHVAARVDQVQAFLGRQLILENPSSYLSFAHSTVAEPDFLAELARRTGCGLLLDVNNVFVSCFNAGTDPRDYLEAFPFERVVQLHLAGHSHRGTHIVDTHDSPVRAEVWALFARAWEATNGAATLLEWDGDIPSFETCHAELLKARDHMAGDIGEALETSLAADSQDGVSTPVDFMIPNAMASVRGERV